MSEEPTAAPVTPMAEEGLEPAAEAERQFQQEVLPEELAYLRDRRASVGLAADATAEAQPELERELVGLALSGGGIRSATFNLGLLQALHRGGLLRWIDYLSTVSGGGFIGAALTALASDAARKGRSQEPASFPFEHREQTSEPEALGWLRAHSEYLAPQGVFDYLKAFALFTRGIALNLLLLLPVLLTLGLLGALLWDHMLYAHERKEAWTAATAKALAERWDGEPADSPVGAVLQELEANEGLDQERGRKALEAEPSLLVRESSGQRPRFANGAGWPEIAARMAAAERDRPWQRLYAVRSNRALSYSHGDGLWEHRLDGRPGPRYYLWTDRHPVSAAAFSPNGKLIGAVGQDGTVWVWSVQLESGALAKRRRIHRSRHSESAPLSRVRFTADSRRMVAEGRAGSILLWSVVDRPDAAQPELVAFNRSDPARLIAAPDRADPALCGVCTFEQGKFPVWVWVTKPGSDRVQPGRAPLSRLAGLAEKPITLSVPLARTPMEMDEHVIQPSEREWTPEVLRLDASFGMLKWLLLVFVLLYPALMILATPLKGLAWMVAAAAGTIVSRMSRPLIGGGLGQDAAPAATADDPAAGADKGRGFFAVVLLGLFQAAALVTFRLVPFETYSLDGFSFGAGLMLLFFWLGAVVLFVPMLRSWESRTETAVGSGSLLGAAVRLATLMLPSGYVALGLAGEPGWPLAITWLALLVLLVWPLLRVRRAPDVVAAEDPRRRKVRHRRLAARLYAAACLLPWLMLSTMVVNIRGGYVEEAIHALFEASGAGEWATALRLPRLAGALYLVGVALILWKLFARLAGGRRKPATRKIRRARRRWTAWVASFGWRDAYERAFALALVALGVVVFLEIQPYALFHYHRLMAGEAANWTRLLAVVSFLTIVLAAMSLPVFKGVGKKLILLVLGVLGPLLPFLVYLRTIDKLVYSERWAGFRDILHPPDPMDGVMLAFFLLLSSIAACYLLGKLVDANLTSMHGFYRDRLCQAYLVGIDTDGRIGPEKELPLPEICPPGSGAPYHLVNASLNMQGEGEGAVRWRNSDFFVFSKLWCGGPPTGYCRTDDLGYLAPDLHLGSAMAVSGAAASPNMGSYTSRALVMLMTFLNVRLGLWLPSPGHTRRLAERGEIEPVRGLGDRLRRWWRRLLARPSGYYLVHEMLSRLHARRPWVNLSDGGHLENTGAYELLRRRCRLILIGDAEADPAVTFGSLAALIRYARIDLGIEIDADLGPLRRREDGISNEHFVVGTIRYPPDGGRGPETGYLIYVKTSLAGDEGEAIREYRARHPTFPHESTADQGFEEDQFEAYRALGLHVGDRLTARAGELTSMSELDRWVAKLAPAAAPAG